MIRLVGDKQGVVLLERAEDRRELAFARGPHLNRAVETVRWMEERRCMDSGGSCWWIQRSEGATAREAVKRHLCEAKEPAASGTRR